MKKLFATITMLAIVLSATSGVIFTPLGPANVKLTAITQTTGFHQTGGKTNISATATNITSVFKATTASVPFDGADLLALLENSYNTNFVTGAQIGMRFGSLVVVDRTGTNLIFNPFNVVTFQFDEDFESGVETEMISQNSSGTTDVGSVTEVFTVSATMTYDDTLFTTDDGTHTKFAFKGLYVVKVSENSKTRLTKTTSEFQGTGGGPVKGVGTILTGTITVKASGIQPAT